MTREELYALTPEDVAVFIGTDRYNVRPRELPINEGYDWEIRLIGGDPDNWSGMTERWFLNYDWVVDKPLTSISVSVCRYCSGRFVQQAGEHRLSLCAECAKVAV